MNIPPFSRTIAGRCILNFPGYEFTKGKIYCVIGPNGSGKSTFAKILARVQRADKRLPNWDFSVGYMPQKSFAFRMSTRANLLLAAREEAKADQLLQALHLTHLAKQRADRLSGGETARMALARLMMKSYDLVILDEPTAAMDIEMTLIAEQEIRRYAAQTGCAVVLVTHSIHQAQRMADEILFFQDGNLLESGPSSMLTTPNKPETAQFLHFYGIG